jgi:hypothetical protein
VISESAGYDIFVSYASEDFPWVHDNLYLPLLKCRLPGGTPPRIYLDKSDLGLKPGEMFPDALMRAVRNSRRLIAVVSPSYVDPQKAGWTQLELITARSHDPIAREGKVIPVVIGSDQNTLSILGELCGPMHFLDVRCVPDWFTRLREAVGLEAGEILRELQFTASIPDIIVNNTIPNVTVTLIDESETVHSDEFVEVSASADGLQGTLKKPIVKGIATFTDLSFRNPAQQVRLTAKGNGCKPATSNTFEIVQLSLQPPAAPMKTSEVVASIPFRGPPGQSRLWFFPSGRAVVVVDPATVRVCDLSGTELGRIAKDIRPRFVRVENGTILIAGWSGGILLVREDGLIVESSLRPSGFPFSVPGDGLVESESSLVGMWNGDVFRLDFQGERDLLFNHQEGVQSMVAARESIFLVDLSGNFAVYEGNRKVYTTPVEKSVVGMKVFPSAVVIVGERYAYQFSPGERKLIACTWLLVSAFSDAMSTPQGVLAVNRYGHGLLLDQELIERLHFHTTAGALPHCFGSNPGGFYFAFTYPDNTCVLLKNGQVIFTNPSGLLSFDPNLNWVAVGRTEDIQIRNGNWIKEIEQATL